MLLEDAAAGPGALSSVLQQCKHILRTEGLRYGGEILREGNRAVARERGLEVMRRGVYRNYVANMYMEKQDYVQAKRHLDEAYKLNAKHPETLVRNATYFY